MSRASQEISEGQGGFSFGKAEDRREVVSVTAGSCSLTLCLHAIALRRGWRIAQVMPGKAFADRSEIRRERVRAVCDAAAECMLEIRKELVSMTLGNVCEPQRATIF